MRYKGFKYAAQRKGMVIDLNEGLVVVVRGLIAVASLLIYARILGKQQISQLTFFDYILGITIGSTASSLTTDLSSRAWPHWVGLTTWFAAVYLLQWIVLKSRKASKYIDGDPTVLILNGEIMDNAMKKMRLRISDLLILLREKDVFDISQVEFAVLETGGKLSVLKKSQYEPVTPKDLNINTSYVGMCSELISDGKVMEENLKQLNLDHAWLDSQLKTRGINDTSEVFLASLNTAGELYIDKYKDRAKKFPDPEDFQKIEGGGK